MDVDEGASGKGREPAKADGKTLGRAIDVGEKHERGRVLAEATDELALHVRGERASVSHRVACVSIQELHDGLLVVAPSEIGLEHFNGRHQDASHALRWCRTCLATSAAWCSINMCPAPSMSSKWEVP